MQGSLSIPFTLVESESRKTGIIERFPFLCGRLPDSDLVLAHPYVSRRHAQIIWEDGKYYVVDLGSRHGTYLNGELIQGRARLHEGDALGFGVREGSVLHFGGKDRTSSSTIRELVEQLPSVGGSSTAIEKLRWFFEAARRLTGEGGIHHILESLIETTLQLTAVERGYVFLRDNAGHITLAMGRTSTGEPLTDDNTVSHAAIEQALSTAKEFIVTDTLTAEHQSESVVAHNIRSVICLPLRKRRGWGSSRGHEVLGLLYLDSRFKQGSLSQVDSDLLRTIATDAAALIDNAQLAMAEENERRYREELDFAAKIQQDLMVSKLPTLPFANVAAKSVPCREIGGDFYLALTDGETLSVALADISGKGAAAAILASTLQGMIYAQLLSRQPLDAIAAAVNQYICEKSISRFATMCILRIAPNGALEYINCGHIPPFVCTGDSHLRLTEGSLPVGMLQQASYQAHTTQLAPGARIVIVSDGVTEAHCGDGEFYGEDRVAAAAVQCLSLEKIFEEVTAYCGTEANDDDCTILQVQYTG
jgi:sigma-B regulation protein RsbU (phosphoserine phosphatase)